MKIEPVKKILGHSAFPAFLMALALLISAPTWRIPFLGDDLVQACKLLASHPVKELGYFKDTDRFGPATRSLFDWFHPGLTRDAMEFGVLPWWTDERAQQSFWRPLAATTHWIDYRLWPFRPGLMHVQSAIWFGGFILAAWALYRGLGGAAWVTGLAALILALNQENWQTLVWIAARNSLITAFFVALTLGLYHRGVSRSTPRWVVASWVSFGLGLLAGEGAVTAAAYLFSYAIFVDHRVWRHRIPGLVPFGVMVIAWRVIYHALGCGVAHSGLYIDPGEDPLRFVLNLVEWGPIIVANVFSFPLLGKYASLAPPYQLWAWGVGMASLVALAAVFAPLLRADRLARFWMLGLLLTMIPACATTVPDDRITLYAALGFAPLVAAFVVGVVDGAAWIPRDGVSLRCIQGAAVLLVVFHLVQPLVGHARHLSWLFHRVLPQDGVAQVLKAAPDQELVLVNSPDVMYLSYLPFFLAQDKTALPRGMRILSSALGDTLVRRTGTNVVVLSSAGPLIPARPLGSELPAAVPRLHWLYKNQTIATAFRARENTFLPGDKVTLPGMRVEVARVNPRGLPVEVTVTFSRSLDDRRNQWVFWDSRAGHYASFTLPSVGGEKVLAGPLLPTTPP